MYLHLGKDLARKSSMGDVPDQPIAGEELRLLVTPLSTHETRVCACLGSPAGLDVGRNLLADMERKCLKSGDLCESPGAQQQRSEDLRDQDNRDAVPGQPIDGSVAYMGGELGWPNLDLDWPSKEWRLCHECIVDYDAPSVLDDLWGWLTNMTMTASARYVERGHSGAYRWCETAEREQTDIYMIMTIQRARPRISTPYRFMAQVQVIIPGVVDQRTLRSVGYIDITAIRANQSRVCLHACEVPDNAIGLMPLAVRIAQDDFLTNVWEELLTYLADKARQHSIPASGVSLETQARIVPIQGAKLLLPEPDAKPEEEPGLESVPGNKQPTQSMPRAESKPRVPSREPELRTWMAAWPVYKPLWEKWKSPRKIREFLELSDDPDLRELALSDDTIRDVIKAGLYGLLD